MTIFSAGLGWATTIIPRAYTFYASAGLFFIFGIKLLKEGYPYREITKSANCSPNEIVKVKRERANETNVSLKVKSVCSRVFDSLQKRNFITQIVIDNDIEPELVLKIQENYLNLIGKGIVSLLINQKDVGLIIDMVEYLSENFPHRKKLNDLIQLQR